MDWSKRRRRREFPWPPSFPPPPAPLTRSPAEFERGEEATRRVASQKKQTNRPRNPWPSDARAATLCHWQTENRVGSRVCHSCSSMVRLFYDKRETARAPFPLLLSNSAAGRGERGEGQTRTAGRPLLPNQQAILKGRKKRRRNEGLVGLDCDCDGGGKTRSLFFLLAGERGKMNARNVAATPLLFTCGEAVRS